jgi:hypothetical protein
MGIPARLRRAAVTMAVALLLAAIAQEMAKPRAERGWRGRVLGLVPYDLNPPTWERVRNAYWNQHDPRLFTETWLGVGWAINFHRAAGLLSRRFNRLANEHARPISLRRSARG